MKSFEQLTEIQKKAALEKAIQYVLQGIAEGVMRFNDKLNGDDLQARIDRAFEKAERLSTPWFIGEILMEDKYIREHVEGMAQCDAEDAIYLERGEHAVSGVAS